MRVRSSPTLAIIALLALALPAWAHHSHGNYNMEAFTNLQGTVKEVRWMNPHSFIYMEIADGKAEPIVWSLETASITQLSRKGINKESIKPGDKITVRCHQLRDGSNGCLLGYVTMAGGSETLFD
jgi:hypothetical protein